MTIPTTIVTNTLVKVNPKQDAEVMAFYDQANKLLEYANTRTIVTVDDAKAATNDLSLIANLRKAMEKKRKDYLLPFQEHIKEVNAVYQVYMEPIEQADKITRNKWTAWKNEQDRLKAEQERINNLRIEAQRAEAALNNGEIKEEIKLVEVIVAPKRTVTDMGTASQKQNWTYEILSFKDLSDDYKLPNTSALNALAKSVKDTRVITGLRIFNNPGMVVRPK